MAFDDLPDDWPSRPLTDPVLVRDVLDLVVSDRDRRAGSIAVLICDGDHRLRLPVVINDVAQIRSDAERRRGLATILGAVKELDAPDAGGRPAVHVAIARRDGLSITRSDHSWQQAAAAACGSDIDLLGVHLVTCSGSRAVPAPDRAAS